MHKRIRITYLVLRFKPKYRWKRAGKGVVGKKGGGLWVRGSPIGRRNLFRSSQVPSALSDTVALIKVLPLLPTERYFALYRRSVPLVSRGDRFAVV